MMNCFTHRRPRPTIRVWHTWGRKVAAGRRRGPCMLGFHDRGCAATAGATGRRRHGGDPAAPGPAGPGWRAAASLLLDLMERTADLGDIAVSTDLETRPGAAGRRVPSTGRGEFVIVLGGRHETAYGHSGLRAHGAVGGHHSTGIPRGRARLKEGLGHSGSPFRQAMLQPLDVPGLRVAGLLRSRWADAPWLLADHGGGSVWREDLTSAAQVGKLYAAAKETTLVTFDIDAVDQAFAPGVSAPAAGGLPADLWLAAAYQAGRCPEVTSCDVV